jgi:hypothetical protein
MIRDQLAELGILFTPYAWAGHVLLGLALQAVIALPLRWAGARSAWWIAAAGSIGFWWGREKMEFEFALKAVAQLHTVGPFWWRGWLPFEWDHASQLQFAAPALANLAVAALDAWRRARSHPGP